MVRISAVTSFSCKLVRSSPRRVSSRWSVSLVIFFRAPDKMTLFGSSLKLTADETLFLELALRGYDLSKLKEDQPREHTAEILKIGN